VPHRHKRHRVIGPDPTSLADKSADFADVAVNAPKTEVMHVREDEHTHTGVTEAEAAAVTSTYEHTCECCPGKAFKTPFAPAPFLLVLVAGRVGGDGKARQHFASNRPGHGSEGRVTSAAVLREAGTAPTHHQMWRGAARRRAPWRARELVASRARTRVVVTLRQQRIEIIGVLARVRVPTLHKKKGLLLACCNKNKVMTEHHMPQRFRNAVLPSLLSSRRSCRNLWMTDEHAFKVR